MLKEYKNVRQIPGEARRRWFSDNYFDLIVWMSEDEIVGFQLCYDISKAHRALTWHQDIGFSHHRIDDGESRPGHVKASPILLPDGQFDYERIAQRFKQASQFIEERIATFVHDTLMQYPLR
jgi:hypothetical protein